MNLTRDTIERVHIIAHAREALEKNCPEFSKLSSLTSIEHILLPNFSAIPLKYKWGDDHYIRLAYSVLTHNNPKGYFHLGSLADQNDSKIAAKTLDDDGRPLRIESSNPPDDVMFIPENVYEAVAPEIDVSASTHSERAICCNLEVREWFNNDLNQLREVAEVFLANLVQEQNEVNQQFDTRIIIVCNNLMDDLISLNKLENVKSIEQLGNGRAILIHTTEAGSLGATTRTALMAMGFKVV